VRAIVYPATIFLSAVLLFLVQPIVAKQILPWFGGSASVWTTCLFFFQLLLLVGYSYAHALTRWASPRRQVIIHCLLLAVSLASLPVIASAAWKAGDGEPALRILALLASVVGLPYFLLATTSPLVQAWYARSMGSPYRLFALSNAASLLGLLAYPFLLEPAMTTATQAWLWSAGYVLFVLLCGAAAWASLGTVVASAAPGGDGDPLIPEDATAPASPVTVAATVSWIMLAALGSLALVSVTAFISQSIASIPLIWIVPLTIYLITFIIAFDGRIPVHGWPVAVPALVLAGAMIVARQSEDFISNFPLSLPLFLAGLFFVCLLCHGELAASKPHPRRLTYFYLMVSLGGALGSLGGSVLAPAVLNGDFELPLILTAVGFAFAWQIRRGPEPVISVAVALVAASVMLGMSVKSIHDQIKGTRLLARNFYASLRVMDTGEDKVRRRQLEHGGIEHGAQFLDPARRHTPLTYYGPRSGIGLAIARQRELAAGRPLSVGVVGLGAGTLAAWGEPDGKVKFYEINPRVLSIANSEFFFLADAMAGKTQVETALGDARLVMEREPPQRFDVLAVDAFSGDAIPMHLLTREAIAIYRRHVAEGGVLAIHISNKFVELGPAVGALARDAKLDARVVDHDAEEDDEDGQNASSWVILPLAAAWWDGGAAAGKAKPLSVPDGQAVWTDDFNNLAAAVRLPRRDE
jgi:hypothetical protein